MTSLKTSIKTITYLSDIGCLEIQGASLVGAAVVPAIQGYIADMFHSLQLSFLVSMLCFVYVGVYFWRESKVRNALAEVTES